MIMEGGGSWRLFDLLDRSLGNAQNAAAAVMIKIQSSVPIYLTSCGYFHPKYFLEYSPQIFSRIIIIIINGTLARSLEPVVTKCKEHTIHPNASRG